MEELQIVVEVAVVTMEVNADDNIRILGFADSDRPDPERYVILTRGLEADEQDRQLGLDGCDAEFSFLDVEGYDVIEQVTLRDRQLVLIVPTDDGSARVTLDLRRASFDPQALREHLRLLFEAKFTE